MDETRMSKGWRRLIVILCTLLLAGSVFLFLGMTVLAQEQQPTEQPAGTEQPAQTTQQPAQTGQTTQQQGLVVDYWEPQVGTRTVYYVNDSLNDIHGNLYGTMMLGYWDAAFLYSTSIARINYASSYYRSVEAVSEMVSVYYDLVGPWYFRMTTPYRYIEEVVGINEAPDAALFPQATFAVRYTVIGSGGVRVWGYSYRSNDATEKTWKEWGETVEFFPSGEEYARKDVVYFRSPHDKKTAVSRTIATFPMSVGSSGAVDAVYVHGGDINDVSASATYKVVAEGELTLYSGTYDALLLEYSWTSPPDGSRYTHIEYAWFVPEMGFVVDVLSLPNIVGPTFEAALDATVLESQTVPQAK